MSRAHQDALVLVGLLCERFPNAFFAFQKRRKPLKIGIDRDIADRLGDAIDRKTLALALRLYTHNFFYRMAQKAGHARIDLDGNPCGEVSEADAASAAKDVANRKAAAAKQPQSLRKPAETEPEIKPAPTPPRDGLASLKAAAQRRKAMA